MTTTLTREQVALAKPGPALDRLVHRVVVGSQRLPPRSFWHRLTRFVCDVLAIPERPPAYSTDVRDTLMLLADANYFRGWRLERHVNGLDWVATAGSWYDDSTWVTAGGVTLPHAVCRAAILYQMRKREYVV
jgi:hypothetical protein